MDIQQLFNGLASFQDQIGSRKADRSQPNTQSLRHTVAPTLREAGVDGRHIADLLGQKTPSMARRYSLLANMPKRTAKPWQHWKKERRAKIVKSFARGRNLDNAPIEIKVLLYINLKTSEKLSGGTLCSNFWAANNDRYKNLLFREKTWHLRMRVPERYTSIEGRKEIQRTLRTGDIEEAQVRRLSYSPNVEQVLA